MSIIPIRSEQPVEPPPNRGRLLDKYEVAEKVGGVSPDWARANMPHKLTLGRRTVRWYEADVDA